jgi:hypothetical protein
MRPERGTHELAQVLVRSAAAAAADGGRVSTSPLLGFTVLGGLVNVLTEVRMWLKAFIGRCKWGEARRCFVCGEITTAGLSRGLSRVLSSYLPQESAGVALN